MEKTIKALLERPIAYSPVVAKATGSVKLTVLWCQIHYWTDRARDPEGWVYKTAENILDETGLSRKEQQTARDLAESLGVMETKVKGTPPTLHFRVNMEGMIGQIERYLSQSDAKIEKKDRKVNPETSFDWIKCVPDSDLDDLAKKFNVTREFILARAEDVRDYCEAKGKKYSNYKAALRNFIKSHRGPKEAPRQAQAAKPEQKQPWQQAEEKRERTPEEKDRYDKTIREAREIMKRKMTMK